LIMLHSRLSVRPGSGIRKSTVHDFAEEDNSSYTSNLGDCVLALTDCYKQASQARDVLRTGSSDLSRIQKILDHEKLYILVGERTVREYKADITEVIEPQIKELIERAEKGLKILERREASLQAKVDTVTARPVSRTAVVTSGMSKLDARRMQMLVNQRQKLEEELLALEADVLGLEKKPLSKIRR